jgi:hypothetical protein
LLSVHCGTIPDMAATASPSPSDYGQLLEALKRQVRSSHAETMRAANAQMLEMYRTIGRSVLERMRDGWSSEVVERMGADLRERFPGSIAFSPGNLDYMRRFAEAWPDRLVAPPLEHLPWGHIRVLLDEVAHPQLREWYAAEAVQHGWSESVLRPPSLIWV